MFDDWGSESLERSTLCIHIREGLPSIHLIQKKNFDREPRRRKKKDTYDSTSETCGLVYRKCVGFLVDREYDDECESIIKYVVYISMDM